MNELLGVYLASFMWYRRRQGGIWYRVRTTMHPQTEEWTREVGVSDIVLRTEDHSRRESSGKAADRVA